jgi:DHA1 family tetracycline resistance protein-like MFS transporter
MTDQSTATGHPHGPDGSAAAPTRARRVRGQLPWTAQVMVGTAFVVALGYGIVAPALPVFATSFEVGVAASSVVISSFALFRVAFAPASGRLIRRFGERRLFSGGLAIVALSSCACAFATDYWQLLAFRSVGGVGSTLFTVSAASLLIRVAPEHLRGRATGAWAIAFLMGTVAGPLVGGVLITFDLRFPFLVYAALLVLAAFVSGEVLRGQPGGRPAPDRAAAVAVTFTAALRNSTFRAALTSNFVHGWTVYGVWVALVPLYVVGVLRSSTGASGAVLAISAGGTVLALYVSSRWADGHGRRLPVAVGLATSVLGALGPWFTSSLPAFVIASLLAGLGAGLVEVPTNAAVADVVAGPGRDADNGTALAGFQMVGDVGAVVGPVLAGLTAQALGYPAAFATTALIAVVSLLFWATAPETAPGRPAPSSVTT